MDNKKQQLLNSKLVLSIEDGSILRKFSILFLVMSLIPVVTLFYLYTQINQYGGGVLNAADLNVTLIIIVIGSIIGYFAMRSVLMKLVRLTNLYRQRLENYTNTKHLFELDRTQNEIHILDKTFNEISRKLDDSVKTLDITKKTLHTVLGKIGHGISTLQNIDTFLEIILETMTNALLAKKSVIFLTNGNPNLLTAKVMFGVEPKPRFPIRILIRPQSGLHYVMASRQPVLINELPPDLVEFHDHAFLLEPPVICAPLVAFDRVIGVLMVSRGKEGKEFDEEEIRFLSNLSTQIAVAVENSRGKVDIEDTYYETIAALAIAVDAKDKYFRGHPERVAEYATQIARRLGVEDHEIKLIRDAARIHDLGKIGIPDDVLAKEGALTEQEWILIKRHPEIGESIIRPIKSLSHLCDIVRHHHEKLDGSGYPDGLRGDQISPLVRIVTVADIYDALTCNRSYRKKLSRDEAFQVLRDMGDQLDQNIVEVFVEFLTENSHLLTTPD